MAAYAQPPATSPTAPAAPSPAEIAVANGESIAPTSVLRRGGAPQAFVRFGWRAAARKMGRYVAFRPGIGRILSLVRVAS